MKMRLESGTRGGVCVCVCVCVRCIIPLQLLVEAKNESSFYDDGLQESHFPP